MTVTFIGHGYVGLVTASVFADVGNTVWVIGHTPEKIKKLRNGVIPIYEPGLEEVVKRNIKAKRLLFTLEYDKAIPVSDIVFIAVGTPSREDGKADLSTAFSVVEKTAKYLDGYTVIATKSTVPIGTNREIKKLIEKMKPAKATFDIASVPEFLREGSALNDTLHPDRVVIGTESEASEKMLVDIHKPIDGQLLLTTIESAEMIKYASNAFLSTKISFANAIAKLCESTGADVGEVLKGVGLDKRIGRGFLDAGVGFGGSCFPKDVKALIAIAREHGYDFELLKVVAAINRQARSDFVKKAKKLLKNNVKGKTVGVWGLAFKPNTDDMRDAPSIDIIKDLKNEGAKIIAYDPVAMNNAKEILRNITYCNSPYEAARNADIILVITEWNEFKEIDIERIKGLMKTPIILDGRNVYDPLRIRAFGFTYQGVGR